MNEQKRINLKKVAAVPGMEGNEDERYPILGSLIWDSLRDVRITITRRGRNQAIPLVGSC